MRVAIYGGSFNPPHVGHTMVAAWLIWTEQVDEVWLVPTFSHAFGKRLLPFEHRVQLCRAMAETVGDRVSVTTIEKDLPSPSYTIDTLTRLDERHPAHTFRLVVGADVVPDTHKWKQWNKIESRFSPIIVGRGGYPAVPGAPVFPTLSSTQVRAAWSSGEDISGLVPQKVLQALKGATFSE